ncbi:MAG: AraC family transcriptional regulator [Curvibacter sp.]|nr:AraC family transcriptional regulator [Curvibacter sp.]
MTSLALLLAGYSIFCALSVAWTQFLARPYQDPYQDQPLSRRMGLVLLLALAGLQGAHFADLSLHQGWQDTLAYRLTLFLVAPSFHLFSRPLLQGPGLRPSRVPPWLHFVPAVLALVLPPQAARTTAFLIGAGYLLWLGHSLMALRHERARFSAEATLLGTALLLAAGVAALGVLPALLPAELFTALYASAIGLAFLLVQTTLSLRPQLPAEVREAAQATYLNTTLAKVDCEDTLRRLGALMAQQRLFTDPELSLAALAESLGLSPHQLSELLNTRLGKGFARYVRELRIDAARTMLVERPAASVLSVGMEVGFTSQSTFYEAFREIEGSTPGQYRKLHRRPTVVSDSSAPIG